jgi:hypothetical protein
MGYILEQILRANSTSGCGMLVPIQNLCRWVISHLFSQPNEMGTRGKHFTWRLTL